MAASLGARLLGCGARSSLPPPYKVCGAPRRRQRPTWAPGSGKLQALDFQAVSLESRAPPPTPPGPTGGPRPELPSMAFHSQAPRGLPSTCWGSKGKCIQEPTSCQIPHWGN